MESSALNLAGRHANAYAMDQTAPHEEVIFDEIVVSTQPAIPSPVRNNSTIATSSKNATRSNPQFTFQGVQRRTLKNTYRKSISTIPTPSEPSEATVERGTPRRMIETQSFATAKGPNEAIHIPVSKPRKVKAYCANCQERRNNGRYKVHHCQDCQYFESDTQTAARNAPIRSVTPYLTSPTRIDKIYCEECIGRKHEPGDNGRSRKNAKHKCAKCLKLRDEAASREGSTSQTQSQSQSVNAASENGTGSSFSSGSKQPRKITNDKAAKLTREFVYRKAKIAPGTLHWVYGGSNFRNEDEDREDTDESGNKTDENENYDTQRHIPDPSQNSYSGTSLRRTQDFPEMLTRRDHIWGVWVPNFDPERLIATFGLRKCLDAKRKQDLQLFQRNGERWGTTKIRLGPAWAVDSQPPPPNNNPLDANNEQGARMPALVKDSPPLPRTTSDPRFQPWGHPNAMLSR